ncbi:multicopper oxidase family protein (plasmid) [Streptomyces mirabilis]|uniref:multicopper oxidase family protein n=1 Tax=Streptomyces mirabilis TaxID=68239 RepID=UPI001BAED007|nr:multicopper oxidase family protein [Streptomyces mirabilis]QUW85479.1 multicopper oxidase family protein [Streptomyces mirabilis]
MSTRWFTPRWLVALVAGAGVGIGLWASGSPKPRASALVGPGDRAVGTAEAARRAKDARVRDVTLTAAPTTLRLDGRKVTTWAFNQTVPGPQIRVNAGDVLRARVINRLPQPLTVHWHGIALRNDMDGVPDVTQKAIKPGGQFVYRFTVTDPGTFFYHSHVGTQLDRGLYGPLIVDDPRDTTAPRRDITVLLDDWIDGTGQTPDQVLTKLRSGATTGMDSSGTGSPDMGSMPGMSSASSDSSSSGSQMSENMPTRTSPLGEDTTDLTYPYYLINGRPATDPATVTVTPGERIRLRIINAASTTPFRVAVGGSRLTVTASDGFPVRPVTADTILLGMGERYDAVVTVPRSGAVPLVAKAEGTSAQALAVLRTGTGTNPMPDTKVKELAGRLLTYADLHATRAAALPARTPERTYTVNLTGTMTTYKWGIAAAKEGSATLPVRQGQRIRLVLKNETMMWHPMHLHGHTFQLVTGSAPGPRKDTVIVPPMSRVTVDLDANNPGQWALHCHNIYHAEAGMLTTLSYVKK